MCRYCLDADPDTPEWKRPHFPSCTYCLYSFMWTRHSSDSTISVSRIRENKQLMYEHTSAKSISHAKDTELYTQHHLRGCEYAKVEG